MVLDQVAAVLKNPVVSTGLKIVAPQIAFGIDAVMGMISALKGRRGRKRQAQLLTVLDARLAILIKQLATSQSRPLQRETEIRIHELLGLLQKL